MSKQSLAGMLMMNFFATNLILMMASLAIGIVIALLLSFIIAEDAILRDSKHPVVWGVCTFFSFCTVAIYYLTRHAKIPVIKGPAVAMPPDGLFHYAQYVMKKQKIRMKIVIWILGISFATLITLSLTFVLFAISIN